LHGSAALVHALLDKGIVDELRLMVLPTILGNGRKLFGQTDAVTLQLVSATPLGRDGVLLLIYRRSPPLAGAFASRTREHSA
jgi:dihydrofolate reductase